MTKKEEEEVPVTSGRGHKVLYEAPDNQFAIPMVKRSRLEESGSDRLMAMKCTFNSML